MNSACAKLFAVTGRDQGYEFLQSKIAQHDYRARGIEIANDEIFLSDGSKNDCAFDSRYFGRSKPDRDHRSRLPRLRRHQCDGRSHRTGARQADVLSELFICPARTENKFVAEPPNEHADLVYLCFPNNPTGAVASREQLDSLGRIRAASMKLSSFSMPPTKATSAIHRFRTRFSKYPARSNVPSSFTVFPRPAGSLACVADSLSCRNRSMLAQRRARKCRLHPLWQRRWSTKANGVSYPVQRAAEALYSDEGRAQVRALIDHYMGNARILAEAARKIGLEVFGGTNAPYIWVKTPHGLTSWQMFDRMLKELNVVITPGSGFGSNGEGYIPNFRIQQPRERRRSCAPFAKTEVIVLGSSSCRQSRGK